MIKERILSMCEGAGAWFKVIPRCSVQVPENTDDQTYEPPLW